MELEDESDCISLSTPQSPTHHEQEERHCTGGAGVLPPHAPSEQQDHSPFPTAPLTAAQSLSPRVSRTREVYLM